MFVKYENCADIRMASGNQRFENLEFSNFLVARVYFVSQCSANCCSEAAVLKPVE